ncbi:MAG: hypothetical protein EOM50_23500, partial [Erysipelotrichia bacterium]|nr:hypothetical protein [Erysipelotrichia bacterium]
MRERLLATFDASLNVDQETQKTVTYIQKSFFDFSELFTKFDSSNLCNLYEVTFGHKKLLFQMINTAWMSQKQEQPGKIIFPKNAFKGFNAENYNCVFTIMHHPYNWLSPDNCADFLRYIRQTTDVLIIGHEHRKDSFTSVGEEWSISEFHGKELQNDSNSNSAFSIYQFDDDFQKVTTFDFSWKDTIYHQLFACSKMFMRNTLISSLMLTPSKKYIDENIDDPGMIIIHENADYVRLHEIYCWPDLEQIEIQDNTTINHNKKITNDMQSQLLTSSISIIIILFFSVFTILVTSSYKMVNTYNWWGLRESSVWQATEKSDVPLLSGLLLSPNAKMIYETANSIIQENSDEHDPIFCFPQIPIFYTLAERRDPGTFTKVQWFDVATDEKVIDDMEIIRITKPKVILIQDVPLWVKERHES